MKFKNLLIVAVFLFAFLVRFYNFGERITFGPEQAISLISAAENLEKPSLLGIPYLLRQTTSGLQLFTAPLFGYSLIPLILLFNFDPIAITGFFVFLNLFTGFLVFLVSKEIFDEKVALFSAVLFLFSSHMVYHSLFIWTSNYMPLIGVLTICGLYKFKKKQASFWTFALGVLTGVGFGIQYFYLLAGLLVLLVVLKVSKKRVIHGSYFLLGILVGELPTVLFDLKHNFYHLKTLWSYFVETLKFPGQSQLSYYHFLVFWPLLAIFFGLVFSKIFTKSKLASLAMAAVFIYLSLNSSLVSFKNAVGMPSGLTAKKILLASESISRDNPRNFNLSVLMDFDFRGYVLRYPLKYLYKKSPLSVEDYPNAGVLYVLSQKNYDFSQPGVWELRSFLPYKVVLLSEIDDNYGVFKLIK